MPPVTPLVTASKKMPLYRRNEKGNWHGEFKDSTGARIRKSTGTGNKQAAAKILEQWKLDAIQAKHGITNNRVDLLALLDEFADNLSASSGRHRLQTVAKIKRVIETAGWTFANQINRHECERTIRHLQGMRRMKYGQKMSARTQAHYFTAIKSFTKWLTEIRLVLLRDPLAAVKKPTWEADRKLVRRFLLPDEWKWLALTPNAMLYETAIQTGFRASEIMCLTNKSLRDDHLFLPAESTKNRRDAKQYITPQLAERLAGNLPFNAEASAKQIRCDLAIARWLAANSNETSPDFLAPVDSSGCVIDFHSLRHTCGAWLAIKGVNPKIIQVVMRHQSITMTLDIYGHLMPGAERDAIMLFDSLLCGENVT